MSTSRRTSRQWASAITENPDVLSDETQRAIAHLYGGWDRTDASTRRRPRITISTLEDPSIGGTGRATEEIVRDLKRLGFAFAGSATPGTLAAVDAHSLNTTKRVEPRFSGFRHVEPSDYPPKPADERLLPAARGQSVRPVVGASHGHLVLGLPSSLDESLGAGQEIWDLARAVDEREAPPVPVVLLFPHDDNNRASVARHHAARLLAKGVPALAVPGNGATLGVEFLTKFWRNFRGLHAIEERSAHTSGTFREAFFALRHQPDDDEITALSALRGRHGAFLFGASGVEYVRPLRNREHLFRGTWVGSYSEFPLLVDAINRLESAPRRFERLALAYGVNSKSSQRSLKDELAVGPLGL